MYKNGDSLEPRGEGAPPTERSFSLAFSKLQRHHDNKLSSVKPSKFEVQVLASTPCGMWSCSNSKRKSKSKRLE